MKKYIIRLFVLTVATFVSVDTYSQNADSIMVMNRRFKNEIGVDFQNLFKTTPGTAFIWKKKKTGHLISLTFSKNYRFQLGLNGTLPVNQKVTQVDTLKGYYETRESKQFFIQPMFGIERVNFFGRFNLFYGVDYGPYYSYSLSGYTIFGNYNNNGYYYYSYTVNSLTGNAFVPSEVNKYGFSIAPFIGVKYRISERFSASIESSFYLSYYYSLTKLFAIPNYSSNYSTFNQNILSKVATTTSVHGFEFSPKYLRFLTFNYHF